MQIIQEMIEQLHGSLCEYIEATYHISNKSLIQQRKRLLNQSGVIHQTPYLESTPRYKSGLQFSDIVGLPKAALEAFHCLSKPTNDLPKLVYDPPFQHQLEAIEICLVKSQNLILMTGTGSGKTEAFLLPILGKLAHEAKQKPDSFANQPAMRALILYPMNALVNDQLGRLRTMFGDPRLVELFKNWSGRPLRFARYTSRTPYPGIRNSKKDAAKLKSLEEFYCDILNSARNPESETNEVDLNLIKDLKEQGKWPAKPDLSEWFGKKGSRWQDEKSGTFIRAVTLPDDSELLTRHEVQDSPADLLVTNYSMLEYMLMRPIERRIFDLTREFYHKNPSEKFLVVLDEAHLYRGAAGAEVGLLLRRLRDRLDISQDRFQVICTTASFNDHGYAPEFCAQLSGLPSDSFVPISGTLDKRPHCAVGSEHEAEKLAAINLEKFYKAKDDTERLTILKPFLDYRKIFNKFPFEKALYFALDSFGPMGLIINKTMKQAIPLDKLGNIIFPSISTEKANSAVTVLLVLGSIARPDPKSPSLLPGRIHNFFRGLAGLWVCMDPNCSEVPANERGEICGKMYSQPRDTCECGARVYELYTCRNCGTAYARTYTDNIDTPTALWSEPGQIIQTDYGQTKSMLPLDLLLENPINNEIAEPADYDLVSGRLNPPSLGTRNRQVYICSKRLDSNIVEKDDSLNEIEKHGQFIPCANCNKSTKFGRSYVQDHQTKGDQPFQTLVAHQLQIQPPNPVRPTPFAPLQGRKVLTFSDSRQVAARLAPNLQSYSIRDSLRSLIAWGYLRLQKEKKLHHELNLEDLFLAILWGSSNFKVRLRPELKSGESFSVYNTVSEVVQKELTEDNLYYLCLQIRNERPPESLLNDLIKTVQDQFLGFEALAIASLSERGKLTQKLEKLNDLPDLIETPQAKVALARTWLRCWKSHGFWLNNMPASWWMRSKVEGTSIRGHNGKFKSMDQVIIDRNHRRIFRTQWLPTLLEMFTEKIGNKHRLSGKEITLLFEGQWFHCSTCKSVHRPIPGIEHCLDCGQYTVEEINPDSDPVFLARKGFYRKPVMETLKMPNRVPLALVAAEHTAQLNAPQIEDVFSQAEKNELLFQDIDLGKRSTETTAIDVLSSTTTMEVGIDIGTLSGVALRNMPPNRANYQQRSGRAGRRGNTVATVIAFGSADSHDEHYFANPEEMICGNVVDPKLTLDNTEIVRRHIRAFLLQNYHQSRLPKMDPNQRSDLFSVLGTVSEFRLRSSILNRDDLEVWLTENEEYLKERVSVWIPDQLSNNNRYDLISNMMNDCLKAIDEAIRPSQEDNNEDVLDDNDEVVLHENAQFGEFRSNQVSQPEKLLDRLLYCGKLPRYAFPINIATFHVFDKEKSTKFRPIMRYAPQQSLPVALTQYAPSKQVWISGKCFTSGAVYSSNSIDRFAAWDNKKIYMECKNCGFAKTYHTSVLAPKDTRDCEACGSKNTFGPGRNWICPPGFAHPVNTPEVTTPDDIPETSYATRAKLSMGTPDEKSSWIIINEYLKAHQTRQHLLVSNTGPNDEGYTYCTSCGRIESSANQTPLLTNPHPKPFPGFGGEKNCGNTIPARNLVLGTDFITDIVLFSLRIDPPIRLKPGLTSTKIALRTLCEALAIAGSRLLEIEPGEIMAEFRPALTPRGKKGREVEIFLYDTLPGGAGFSSHLAFYGPDLFKLALNILENCPEECDGSCYRCLRSFKNKFEHIFLDRHVGIRLLKFLLTGTVPSTDKGRLNKATKLLYNDLVRQSFDNIKFTLDSPLKINNLNVTAPILAEMNHRRKAIISLSGALTPNIPSETKLTELELDKNLYKLIIKDELLIRSNLPLVSLEINKELQQW